MDMGHMTRNVGGAYNGTRKSQTKYSPENNRKGLKKTKELISS